MINTASLFWKKNILPEIINPQSEMSGISEDENEIYCYCKTKSEGLMIGCDNPNPSLLTYGKLAIKRE